MLTVKTFAVQDVMLIAPQRFADRRGFFSEVFSLRALRDVGLEAEFVQDNHSLSVEQGTVRGLHFQKPPHAQGKLVRVCRGRIPEGFAHGFRTMEPNTEVMYKTTDYYSPQDDAGIAWDDPELAIDWTLTRADAVVSDKDAMLPRLAEIASPFAWTPSRTLAERVA
jgi:dTDP-4-dehydrorhamnose 3,5-epimerase